MSPLVTYIIPSYNHACYVGETIQSIIDQTYQNIELIIIDDGSTDKSVEVIESHVSGCLERFVRFEFRQRGNKGLSETLNEAIEWAEGKYFASLASDDIIFPHKTSTLVNYIEVDGDSVGGVFSGIRTIDLNGDVIANISLRDEYYSFDDIIKRKHAIQAPTQLLRTEYIRLVGGYPRNVYIEDWYMWLAMTHKGYKLRVVRGELAGYRQHGSNISKNIMKMFNARKQILEMFKGHKEWGYSQATIHIMTAIDLPSEKRIEAMGMLYKAVTFYPKVIFSSFFSGALLRLLLPSAVRSTMRRVKSYK